LDDDRFALLCLDLDNFKPINDNFGHQTGDRVLHNLASLFLGLVRDDDIVSRYGGDEFVILLDWAGPDEAKATAQRIQIAVEQYDPHLAHPRLGQLRIGVSVGVACFPRDGADGTSLLAAADAAMYADKTERKLGYLAEPGRDRDGTGIIRLAA
jgi:diguanylate cyclase (GGDEF)-like protein